MLVWGSSGSAIDQDARLDYAVVASLVVVDVLLLHVGDSDTVSEIEMFGLSIVLIDTWYMVRRTSRKP
jgi:hypothetical protein